MIMDKKIKYTKQDKIMAFLTVEDLVGSVEVIVFPQSYEKYSYMLNEESKVFIQGHVSAEEDRDGKLICEKITSFDDIPRKIWLKFPNVTDYTNREQELFAVIAESEGKDSIVIYLEDTKQMKQLPPNRNIHADSQVLEVLRDMLGKDNVRVV